MTRKVSVDSVSDGSADDLLKSLYELTFRRHSSWGWVIAGLFALVPTWLAIVCISEGNIVGGVAFSAMAAFVPALRFLLVHRIPIGKAKMSPNEG